MRSASVLSTCVLVGFDALPERRAHLSGRRRYPADQQRDHLSVSRLDAAYGSTATVEARIRAIKCVHADNPCIQGRTGRTTHTACSPIAAWLRSFHTPARPPAAAATAVLHLPGERSAVARSYVANPPHIGPKVQRAMPRRALQRLGVASSCKPPANGPLARPHTLSDVSARDDVLDAWHFRSPIVGVGG